jgi:predicted nucleic acid-binding protein
MWSEAISTLVEATFRGAIPAAELDAGAERLEALPIALAAVDAGHRRRSIEIARTLGWAKTYDAEYVALAQSLDAPLLTIDARLRRAVARSVTVLVPADLV